MPTTYYRVEAPGVNILDTVSNQVVLGLLSEFDLTYQFKDSVYIMSSFMASSQYSDPEGTPNLIKRRCDVNVEYVLDKAQVPWPVETPFTTTAYGIRGSTAGQRQPILADVNAGILIEHHTSACALDMDFTLTFPTFDEATKAFYTIQSRYKGTLTQTPFDLMFSYPVSASLLGFLLSVFQRKEDYQDKTLMDYIADTRLTQISFDVRTTELNEPDADKQLMVRCLQKRCLGLLTMDMREPDVERENDLPDSYMIKFTYQLQFPIPSMIAVHAPISVDNQVLPPELFSSVMLEHHQFLEKQPLHENIMFEEWLQYFGNAGRSTNPLIHMPEYDDWFTADSLYAFYQYKPVLIHHFTLDADQTVIDLTDMGEVTLHPVVLDILRETGNRVFDYGGLFTLGVYANDLRLGTPLVELSDDLKLTIKTTRRDQVFHFMLSETTDLSKTDGMWDRLLIKYRYFFPLTITRNLTQLVDKKLISVTGSNTLVNLVSSLWNSGRIKRVLTDMVELGEDTNQIFFHTQNPSQLIDYMSVTSSLRSYTQANLDQAPTVVKNYYATTASIDSRSLLVAFIEQCLEKGYVSPQTTPMQYLKENKDMYPYLSTNGGFYGFNTPFRILTTTISGQYH